MCFYLRHLHKNDFMLIFLFSSFNFLFDPFPLQANHSLKTLPFLNQLSNLLFIEIIL